MLCHEWFNLIIIGCFPLLLQTKRRLAGLTLPGIARLFSMSNQGKILDLPGRWWCRDDSDELLPCAMTSGGNVGNFIIQSFPPFFSRVRSVLAAGWRKPMIPGDFHQHKIRFEPLGFSIFCMHIDFIFKFSPRRIRGNAARGTRNAFSDTRRRDGGGLRRYTSTRRRHSAVSEVLIQIIPMSVYRRQTELWQVDAAVKANPRS